MPQLNSSMNLTLSLALMLTALACSSAPSRSQPASRIDSATMLSRVRVLTHDSLQGRRAGSPGGVKAREFIVSQFQSIGLQRLGSEFTHEFTLGQGRDSTSVNAANVIGFVAGTQNPGRYIVISAHYDHLGMNGGEVYNGADDNASGTGGMMALAAWFVRNPPRNSMIFVAFDAEERGLQGAHRFVANPPVPVDSILMNVNLDMIGRNDAGELYVTGTLHYPFLKPFIEQVKNGAPVKLLMGHDEGRGSDNWTSASDHGAFHRVRIPFLYFGVEDHADYHRHTDEFERLQPDFYARAVETVLRAVTLLDANGDAIRAGR